MLRSYCLILVGILCASVCFGQASYKPGYFIDLKGNKTECYIKDNDWKGNPRSFDYKTTEFGATQKMDTDDVSEFKAGTTRFVRAKVQYDQSSQELSKLSINNNPEWTEGNLWLKVVVDGKSTLYHYNSREFSLFFFSVSGSPIEQLVFKNYYTNPGGNQNLIEQKQYSHSNNTYLYQLNTKLKCGDNAEATAKEVPYQLRTLSEFVRKYNICSGDVVTEMPTSKKAFSLRLTPGVDFASATGEQPGIVKWNYGSAKAFRLGADLQFALPFNNGKWAVVAEPTYSSYSGNDTKRKNGLKYTLFELPIGVRHRFFLSEKSYIFLNGMALLDFPLAFKQTFSSGILDKTERGTFGFALGAGFAYGRLSLEARYYPSRTRDTGATIYKSTKSTAILGIRIF